MLDFVRISIAAWNTSVDTGLICAWNTTLEFMDFTCTCNDTNAVLGKSEKTEG
jgi:hypothetical protein